jgi:hypothetical protein
MVVDMASLSTELHPPMEAPTLSTIVSGDAPTVTASATIPARSGARLSEAERMELAKIRRNRNQGWMATFEEFEFLLSTLERVTR